MTHPNGQHGQHEAQQQQALLAQIQMQATQMQGELDALIERNKEGFKALAMRGIQFDPGQLMNARIDTILDSVGEVLGPQGALWVLNARMRFEKLIEAHIEAASDQGRKAQLAQGGSFTPEMIRQLARETGHLGGARR